MGAMFIGIEHPLFLHILFRKFAMYTINEARVRRMDKTIISNRFETFAREECKGSCDLYEYLSKEIAEDDVLLEICMNARDGQPIPNLLFGAVHFLLLQGTGHELKQFYESIVTSPKEPKDSFPYFKDFCVLNRDTIMPLLKSKLVQTNEVRRCGYLYPSFSFIYEKVQKPLALIELGTSAGLQLLWDKYCYSYEADAIYGNPNAEVHIKADVKGNGIPFLRSTSPPVVSRTGIDLHINDLNDPEDYLWLKSLIWPSHHERRHLFETAANEVRQTHLNMIEGDGVMLLPDIVKEIPQHAAICVFHTHVANQLSKEDQFILLENIKRIGEQRDIFHLYNNIQDRNLHLDYYLNGNEHLNTVGEMDGHGSWFSWKWS